MYGVWFDPLFNFIVLNTLNIPFAAEDIEV